MNDPGSRRPVTARDFNRLLFALLLLGALTVMARLVTRQESRADTAVPDVVTTARWAQTADALFVRGEWTAASDAYFSALESAAAGGGRLDPRVYKKLALSLYAGGSRRAGIHFMRCYRRMLEQGAHGGGRVPADGRTEGPDPDLRQQELDYVRAQLDAWATVR